MGAIKSSYAASEYMLYYIEREEYANIKKLLNKYPDILEKSITKKSKMTPLYRACFNGNIKMVQFFVEDCGAQVNTVNDHGESALMVACKRNHKEIVRYLLERGADVNLTSSIDFSTIDYAILPGYYEVALMIYQKVKDKELRSVPEFEDLNETHVYRYVNYQVFLENLIKRIEPENVPEFLTKAVTVYKDPVVDPRESWGQWVRRTMEFKDPPLCQRQDLPEQMQPQNRRWGKMRHTLSNMTMSPMVHQKPHFNPVNSKAAMSEHELQHAPPATNEELQTRSVMP